MKRYMEILKEVVKAYGIGGLKGILVAIGISIIGMPIVALAFKLYEDKTGETIV